MSVDLSRRNVKKELGEILTTLEFFEQITGGSNFDKNKIGLPVPNQYVMELLKSHPKIKFERVYDKNKNLLFSNELINLLKGLNIKIYLLVAKIYHKGLQLINDHNLKSKFDTYERNMVAKIHDKIRVVSKNMYCITGYAYYKEFINS